jgi:hypothetical protein
VAYWYQVPPVVPFARMPVADYRVSGDRRFLLEGELLPIKPDLADRVKPELVGGATVARFTPKTVGDEAVFTLHTVQSGWYEVCGFFTRSSRHGIYQVRISDELLGDPVDFFKAEGGSGRYNEQRSDEIILGMIYLEGGLHEIGFEALEANEKAWGLLLDIDALIFRPVPQPKEDE